MIALLIFPFFYLKEIVSGALYVGYDVLTPRSRINPVLLRVPIELDCRRKRLLLASLITMTPGTLSVDEVDDGKTILVHSLYGGDNPEGTMANIKEKYEKIVASLPI
jgi:multicomponent Na+:H+ antiporter subunit E